VTGILYALAITTAVSLIAFFTSLLPVFITPGPPMSLGLTERILLTAYVAWLCVAAIGLLRSSANRFSMDRMW
jgi:threonine/homoserine/homoserine lactone efflux protein